MQLLQPRIQGKNLLEAEIARLRHAQLQPRHVILMRAGKIAGHLGVRADAAHAQTRQAWDR